MNYPCSECSHVSSSRQEAENHLRSHFPDDTPSNYRWLIAALAILITLSSMTGTAYAAATSASINGRVCVDFNHNQQCDKNEPGVAGVTVTATSYLVGGTASTDSEGRYQISELTAGTPYNISVTAAGVEIAHIASIQAPHNACDLQIAPSHAYLPIVRM